MGKATDWLNVPKKRHREAVKSVEQALAESAVAPNISTSIETPTIIRPDVTMASDSPVNHSQFQVLGSGIPITAQHSIRVKLYYQPLNISTITIVMTGRCLTRSGEIKNIVFQVAFTTPSTQQTNFQTYLIPLPDDAIYLMSLCAYTTNTAVRRGTCFLAARLYATLSNLDQATVQNVNIQTGTQALVDVLMAGYIWTGQLLKLGFTEDPLSGAGFLTHIQGNQALGSDVQWRIFSGVRWRIINLFSFLDTSAAVANRVPVFRLYNSPDSTLIFQQTASNPVTANGGRFYNVCQSDHYFCTTGGVFIDESFRMPEKFYADGDTTAEYGLTSLFADTSTFSLQAGDQWTTAEAYIEQWILPFSGL